MGAFDCPTGNLELLVDGEWKSVCFADVMTDKEIAAFAVTWSRWGHSVTGARYNGKVRSIPKGYLEIEYQFPEDSMPANCSCCPSDVQDVCRCNVTAADGVHLKKVYTRRRHSSCPLKFVPFC